MVCAACGKCLVGGGSTSLESASGQVDSASRGRECTRSAAGITCDAYPCSGGKPRVAPREIVCGDSCSEALCCEQEEDGSNPGPVVWLVGLGMVTVGLLSVGGVYLHRRGKRSATELPRDKELKANPFLSTEYSPSEVSTGSSPSPSDAECANI
eukprot:Hpha_TRINITY_DN16913_c1_g1::TRINITY_DN16913_c1_g1_i2::g.52096::m.52096